MKLHRVLGISLSGLLLLLPLAGCKSPQTDVMGGYSPDLQVITPGQRIEHIEQIGDDIKRYTPEDQVRAANDLTAALKQEVSPDIRSKLIFSLAKNPSQAAETGLFMGLSDSEVEVRCDACTAWGLRGGPIAIRQLSEVLVNDTNPDVRLAAARALGKTKDMAAVPALGRVLEDKDPALQYRAVLSLKSITKEPIGEDVNAWRAYVQSKFPGQDVTNIAQDPATQR